jgi:hypothetical protein
LCLIIFPGIKGARNNTACDTPEEDSFKIRQFLLRELFFHKDSGLDELLD